MFENLPIYNLEEIFELTYNIEQQLLKEGYDLTEFLIDDLSLDLINYWNNSSSQDYAAILFKPKNRKTIQLIRIDDSGIYFFHGKNKILISSITNIKYQLKNFRLTKPKPYG